MVGMTCDDVRDAAAGYALGTVDEDTRAAVASHLRLCPACREEVGRTQASAAWLLDLDSRWEGSWEGTGPAPVGRSRRNLRRVAAMATITALVAATAFGSAVRVSGVTSAAPHNAVPLYSDGIVVGEVEVDSGKAPLVRLAVTGLTAEGRLSVEAVSSTGSAQRLGSLDVRAGRGYWQGPVSSSFREAWELVLADPRGEVVATTSGP